ncbi:Coenzyme F420 hydrogenase/dehydrogenase, beta subunit C-terminal domain [Hespellia stercorisuis]|nr:Coenzyme F420 hydrogenase/dehydrogenase, beta subunit C-terminal domain [Hespellia stercorisuis]
MSQNNIGIIKDNCCGCGICEAVCSAEAIIEKRSVRNSIVYSVKDSCINCGLCLRVCPVNTKEFNKKNDYFYRAISKNEQILNKSSSGGVAYETSKKFIEKGFCVYSAIWSVPNQRVEHRRIKELGDLKSIQGSKYVQSVIDKSTYLEIKKDVVEGRVLFIGCPCQVAAVRNLVNDSKNLYTVDLLCHGVPSPNLLSEQISYLNIKSIRNISFRNRLSFTLSIESCEQIYEVDGYQNPYYSLFLNYSSFRESCYKCIFACEKRVGDITIGDYVENNKGYSCLIPNSEKGTEIVKDLFDSMRLEKRNILDLKGNESYYYPTKKKKEVEKFTRLYEKYGLILAYYCTFYKLAIKKFILRVVGEKTYSHVKSLFKKQS